MPLVYVGGVVDRNGADRVLDKEGFDFIQMGRALINEPDFVNRMASASGNHRCGCDHVTIASHGCTPAKWYATSTVPDCLPALSAK